MALGSAILLLLASGVGGTDCSYDRGAMMALDWRAFDQDPQGGWRSLAAKGCDREAADLIRDWREHHGDDRYILYWHEGQNRAFASDYDAAIALFERSRRPIGQDAIGWNLYVDGSVAFLRGERAAVKSARDALSKIPKPADWDGRKGVDGKPLNMPWPLNLNVLDGFLRCWGKPYRDAYGCPAGG